MQTLKKQPQYRGLESYIVHVHNPSVVYSTERTKHLKIPNIRGALKADVGGATEAEKRDALWLDYGGAFSERHTQGWTKQTWVNMMLEWYHRQMDNPAYAEFGEHLLQFGLCWMTLNSILSSRSELDSCLRSAATLLRLLPDGLTFPGPVNILYTGNWPVSARGIVKA